MIRKTHFKNHKYSGPICNVPSVVAPEVSDDVDNVTCRNCIRTMKSRHMGHEHMYTDNISKDDMQDGQLVRIKTWDKMTKQYGCDDHIHNPGYPFLLEMERNLPENRIIRIVYSDNCSGDPRFKWEGDKGYIEPSMIEEIVEDPENSEPEDLNKTVEEMILDFAFAEPMGADIWIEDDKCCIRVENDDMDAKVFELPLHQINLKEG